MMTGSPITIIEVGPRDGLQSEDRLFSTGEKVSFIEQIIDAGIKRIEVASFVNPARVPQMADAEKLLEALPKLTDVSYSGLILNRRGFDRAAITGIGEIAFVIVASDTFGKRNQGLTTEESLDIWRTILPDARAANIFTSVTIATAFGCPFEGEIPVDKVASIADRIAEIGADEISLADTIGVAAPSNVTLCLEAVRKKVGTLPLRCHFHNTRNTGLANAYAAISAGVTRFDASTGGIGGCPFAPNATGNIPTEDLVYMLDRMHVATGIDIERLLETASWLETKLDTRVPGLVLKAGLFPRQEARGTA